MDKHPNGGFKEEGENQWKKMLTFVLHLFHIPYRSRQPLSHFTCSFSWNIARMRMILWTRIRLTFWSPEEAMKEEEMLTTLVDTIKGMVDTAKIKEKEETIFSVTTTAAMAMSMTKVSITTKPMADTETATLTAAGMLLLPIGTSILAAVTTATTITRISNFSRKQTKHATLSNKQKTHE